LIITNIRNKRANFEFMISSKYHLSNNNILKILLFLCLTLSSCGVYNFTGGTTGTAKSVAVAYFKNEAPNRNPLLAQVMTDKLKDKLLRETRLKVVQDTADMEFSGTIIGYNTSPSAVISNDVASKTRLTITANVKFVNRTDKTKNYETTVSSYSEFDAKLTLADVEAAVVDDATTKLIQEIYNKALNNW
jgi:hypothetical protein